MRKKLIFLLYIWCVSLASAAAQPRPPRPRPPMNYGGRKMMPRESVFALLALKTEEADDGEFFMHLLFSDAIDAFSVSPQNIVLNGRELPSDTRFLFSKSRQSVMFRVPRREIEDESTFSLEVRGIKSFDAREAERVMLSGLTANTFYRLTGENATWQRSL